MALYETIYILRPDIQGDRLAAVDEKVQKVLTTQGATDIQKQDWGLRRLAYPIKNFSTGHYFRVEFSGPGECVFEIERNLGYEDVVLRYLTVKIEKDIYRQLKPGTIERFGPEASERGGFRDRRDRPSFRDSHRESSPGRS